MLKLCAVIHDLCLALLVGGLGAVFIAAFVLFDAAPNHEVAGQVGNALFNLLGPGTLAVTILLTAMRMFLKTAVTPRGLSAITTGLAVIAVLLAGVIAFWLTPVMDTLWKTAPHAPDGSGLSGEDYTRFMSYHGAGSASYLAVWLIAIVLLVMRAATSVRV